MLRARDVVDLIEGTHCVAHGAHGWQHRSDACRRATCCVCSARLPRLRARRLRRSRCACVHARAAHRRARGRAPKHAARHVLGNRAGAGSSLLVSLPAFSYMMLAETQRVPPSLSVQRSQSLDLWRGQVLISASTRDAWLSGTEPKSPDKLLACDGLPRGERWHELTLFSTYVGPQSACTGSFPSPLSD